MKVRDGGGRQAGARVLLVVLMLTVGALLSSVSAGAESEPAILKQAKEAVPGKYRFATDVGAQISATDDGKGFFVYWTPEGSKSRKTPLILTMHGHGSYAFDEFNLWYPYAKKHGYSLLALQWWLGGDPETGPYLEPQEAYRDIDKFLKKRGTAKRSVLLHGFSRASTNTYGIAALDNLIKNQYFAEVISASGGASADFPINRAINGGRLGARPFTGYRWMTYCGGKDPDPRSGCDAMRAAATWVTGLGGTIDKQFEDPEGEHGGFKAHMDEALDIFGSHLGVATADIASSGPLTHIYQGSDLSCQVTYQGDSVSELFPSSATPGDCGTFIAVDGRLYAPDFVRHTSTATSNLGNRDPFTAASQSSVAGSGTSSNPFKVEAVVTAGSTGLRVTQSDSYVAGEESYRTDVKIANEGGESKTLTLYRAGDCYLQGSDTGFGFQDLSNKAVGCSVNAENSPAGRIEEWVPLSTGSNFLESDFRSLWSTIGSRMAFNDTCKCSEQVDQAAGLSWNVTLPAGTETTISHLTVFSPAGTEAQPVTQATAPSVTATESSSVIALPSNRSCVSRRKFRIHFNEPKGFKLRKATVLVNGRSAKVAIGKQLSAPVDLRNLPRGKFTVKIKVTSSAGRVITSSRKYRTCRKKT